MFISLYQTMIDYNKDLILALNTETDEPFLEMHNRFKVYQQFNWQILRPRFRQVGKVGSSTLEGATVFASTCNLGSSVMDQVFINTKGISATKARKAFFIKSFNIKQLNHQFSF